MLLLRPTKSTLMKFLKKIWRKFRGIFKKRPPSTEKIISEEKAVLEQTVNTIDIFKQIAESDNESERANLIRKIAKQNTAKRIIEFTEQDGQTITTNRKGKKRLFELHELRTELQSLEEKKVVLEYAESSILVADYPDTTSIQMQVIFLSTLLNKNKSDDKVELSKISISEYDKSLQQFEKLLIEKSTFRLHTTRETVKQKQEEIYKNQIKQKLSNLEILISQNKLIEAKSIINHLTISIKPTFQKELARLNKSKVKYKERELHNFKKQEEEILKIQAEQAKILSEQEKNRLAELKLRREEEAIQRRTEEEKLIAKANRLKALLSKKANWRDFQKVLQENGISILHHFTDSSNLKSIKENGGLYSWYYCGKNNIEIPMTGNSALGRSLDMEFNLEDYVRLSFIKDHPMKHVAMNEGRITKPYLLNVSIEVCYFENTRFSNMNAADRKHTNKDSVEFLQTLRFDLFHKSYFDLNPIEKKLHQAEVLVKTWIPAEYITNLNND